MSTEIATLEKDAGFIAQINSIAVRDGASYQQAAELVKRVTQYIRRVEEVMGPVVAAALNAHRVAVAQRDNLLKPAQGAKRVLGDRMATYDQEQDRKRREAEEAARREQARLEAEARARAEEEQRRLEAEAEARRPAAAAFAPPEPVPIVLPAPVYAPSPAVVMPTPKVKGVSYREDWSAEVLDLGELVRAIAAGHQSITLVQPNTTALNQVARAFKETMKVPGVRAVCKRIQSVSGATPPPSSSVFAETEEGP